MDRLPIDYHGIAGDRHRGLARPSTGWEAPLYEQSQATIVNRRQLFAVSPYECELLSECLQVQVTPQLLGANLVIGREDGTNYSISEVPNNTDFAIAHEDAKESPQPPLAMLT